MAPYADWNADVSCGSWSMPSRIPRSRCFASTHTGSTPPPYRRVRYNSITTLYCTRSRCRGNFGVSLARAPHASQRHATVTPSIDVLEMPHTTPKNAVLGRASPTSNAGPPARHAGGHRFKSCIAQCCNSLWFKGLRLGSWLRGPQIRPNSGEKCHLSVFLATWW